MSRQLAEFIARTAPDQVKLHLGCGGQRWRDFINIDFHPGPPGRADSSRNGFDADVIADATALGLPSASVDEIFSSHLIEHLTRWQAVDAFVDWSRMLKPRGQLHVETPDFWRCVLWLFDPRPSRRRLARTMFYGNQWDRIDYETHRYVWSAGELKRELQRAGFSRVRIDHRTLTHHPGRDMRVLATR